MIDAWIASRFIHFAAAMAVFGIGAFRLYAFAGSEIAADDPSRAALDALLVRFTGVGATVALLSAAALIPFTAAEMTGSDAAALDPVIWREVLVATEFGRVWCWHLGFAVALLALCFMPRRRWQIGGSTLAALLLLVSLGWVGHAAMDMGGGVSHKINQMAHLTGGGLWLGGLLPLGVLLRRAVRPDGADYVPLARAALPHFSQVGYAAVALIVVTGTVNSVMLVGSFRALLETPYGRLLMVKIALFLAMVGLALINRFRLLPRLRDAATAIVPLRSLFHSVLAEQALGLAILAVVAVLGTWPPAIEAAMQMR
ncbi:MAG TPA: copper homeostasis membrane protein CopD [Stellaceae bacterium]|nr:copper homeostasis membrane protein CopD [Stellaceae bacterium]